MMEKTVKDLIHDAEYDDPRTAIQDGLLQAFNEPRNNDWLAEHEIETKGFDFRDLLKRVFWKRI